MGRVLLVGALEIADRKRSAETLTPAATLCSFTRRPRRPGSDTVTAYSGEWHGDKYNGEGRLTLPDGEKYEGEGPIGARRGSKRLLRRPLSWRGLSVGGGGSLSVLCHMRLPAPYLRAQMPPPSRRLSSPLESLGSTACVLHRSLQGTCE